MMPGLSQIYDEEFFKQWGSSHSAYIESAQLITNRIDELFHPKKIVDLGCGCGVYSHFFNQNGVETLSIDGVIPPSGESFNVPMVIRDLTVPFENIWGDFDLVLCLEVAEHIPPEWCSIFLENMTRLSDTLVLSCAPPKQGGHFHVNEQPKRYWVKELLQYGFVYNRKKTGTLLESFKARPPSYMWMCDQISVYEKVKNKQKIEKNLPFKIRA